MKADLMDQTKRANVLIRYCAAISIAFIAMNVDANINVVKAESLINNIHEISNTLRACWNPPPLQKRTGIVFVIRVSFRGNGTVLGTPFLIFQTPNLSVEDRAIYKTAVDEMLKRCTPLHFSRSLAATIAGHPIVLRIIEGKGTALKA